MSDIFQKHMEYIIEKFDGASAPMMDEDIQGRLGITTSRRFIYMDVKSKYI